MQDLSRNNPRLVHYDVRMRFLSRILNCQGGTWYVENYFWSTMATSYQGGYQEARGKAYDEWREYWKLEDS